MIEKQILYAILKGEKLLAGQLPILLLAQVENFKAHDSAVIIEPEEDINTEGVKLLDFFNYLLKFKTAMKAAGVTNIAIYHTVAYSGQCNFEYNPEELAALQKLGATLCPSAYEAEKTRESFMLIDGIDEEKGESYVEPMIKAFIEEQKLTDATYHFEEHEANMWILETAQLDVYQMFKLGEKYGYSNCLHHVKANKLTLTALIEKIRERPALYMGRTSILHLNSFFAGYFMTNEAPEFDGFNDFVGRYYGKYTTAGWANLILADHYGNEGEAMHRFFDLWDEYENEIKPINSRLILHKLLHLILIDIRHQSHEKQDPNSIWQLTNWLHTLPLELHSATYSKILPEYDRILENIFKDANQNEGLKSYLLDNFEELKSCLYEIWKSENSTLMIVSDDLEKELYVGDKKFVESFFAITFEKAQEISHGKGNF